METGKGVVRVPRDALSNPLTCPLCQDLFREASAFVECLHTFCRECIMKKTDDEEINSCPVCHKYLGIAPQEKLRPDHNIQSIRNKVFPLKEEVDASTVPNIRSPAKRKERSLSSLVVETPNIATQTTLTGQKTKAARRIASSHITSLITNGTTKLLNNSQGDQKTEKTSEPKCTDMTTSANKTQINADVVATNQSSSDDVQNRETIDDEELQKPLHSLVTASGKRSLRLSLKRKRAAAKEDIRKGSKGEVSVRKDVAPDKVAITGIRVGKHSNKLKLVGENNGNYSSDSVSSNGKTTTEDSLRKCTETDLRGKPLKRLVEATRKTSLGSSPKSHGTAAKEDRTKSTNGKLSIRKDDTLHKLAIGKLRKSPEADPLQEPVGSTNTGSSLDGITTPVWFSLVSYPNQVHEKPLPKIPNMYLRIKDRSMRISSILSYITKKLELASHDKLEILCNDWPICPSTTLHRLLEQWLSRKPKQEVRAAVGGPAKEFMMELRYRRCPTAVPLCCVMKKTNSVTTSLACYCST